MTTIRGYELESYLMEDQVIPPKMIEGAGGSSRPNPAYLAWRRQDQLLASWIQSSLTENIMVLMVGLNTTHQIWKALETNFANQCRAKVMQHKSQLQAIKKDTLSMSDYLNKVKGICDVLAASGCSVPEEDQILYILGGLSHDYDPVIVMITARTDTWSVQDASTLLLSFEARLEDDNPKFSKINVDGSAPSANLTHTSGIKRDNHPPQSRNEGGRGAGFGGFRGRGRNFRGRGRLICQLCQKPGHTSERCWYRFEQSFMPSQNFQQRPPPQHSHQPPPSSSMTPSANVAHTRGAPNYYSPSEFTTDNSSSWYPDSGATHHISNDLANLNTASEFHGGPGIQGGHSAGHP